MTTETAETTEERLAAFVAMFRELPAAARHLLEAQAAVFHEQEIRHSERVAGLREQNEVLIAANKATADENARFRHEIETIGAENAALRKEIVALRMECAALREERKGMEILEAAVEQYRAGRRAAETATGASELAAADALSDLAPHAQLRPTRR
jgi:hypothetical protein